MRLGVKVDLKKQYSEAEINRKKGIKKDFTLDVSFEMENELVVLFGPSGSGKTTLFKCISGITEPDSGKITVDNRVYYDKDRKINLPIQKRNLGYVFQNYTLFPHMNVRKNIECGLKEWKKEEREKRVMEMLNLLHIEELEIRYPSQLSGGQKQRVALARALAPRPGILLLDEPFSALDMKIRTRLAEKIKNLQNKIEIPLLFITHNLEEAFLLADRIIILHAGKIQQFGTPEEIFYHPENLHVAELIGISNIFDDAYVEEHNEESKSAVLKSEDMKIKIKPQNFKVGDKVSWGVHPENITLLRADSGSEDQEENIYFAHVDSIVNKGPKKRITLKLVKHNKSLTAEVPAQFVDSLKLSAGGLCLVKLEISKVVAFKST
ncbi:ABC transporter ATP-binding protein [Methanosarcina mazei]|uniref:Molybdate/tungstate import ATP-binding protein WtpC n=1 Tax=Methanosarcina mazei SarPi TaxID=1434115 RepID=A0A0E3RB11_METMZ|nr:ABC transporter ATP-binding protein [Methanosarcina mazei]AKB62327.1 Putrescine transport ATP-binding protein PotA [Methanosarcina mazei SarPi]